MNSAMIGKSQGTDGVLMQATEIEKITFTKIHLCHIAHICKYHINPLLYHIWTWYQEKCLLQLNIYIRDGPISCMGVKQLSLDQRIIIMYSYIIYYMQICSDPQTMDVLDCTSFIWIKHGCSKYSCMQTNFG